MAKNVVFDWDGVFIKQTEYICNALKMPVPDEYDALDAHNISLVQAITLQLSYNDMDLYEHIPFEDGFDEVFSLCPPPYIYTGSTGASMKMFKETVVTHYAPNFPRDHLIIADGRDKPALPFADIVIEDGPRYLDLYDDKVVKILIDHFYNRNAKGPYIRVPTLRAAIEYVKKLV